jgi:hypothetical protein
VFEAFLAAAQCALETLAPVGGRWRLERALLEGRRCAAALGSFGAVYHQSVALMYSAVAAMHRRRDRDGIARRKRFLERLIEQMLDVFG